MGANFARATGSQKTIAGPEVRGITINLSSGRAVKAYWYRADDTQVGNNKLPADPYHIGKYMSRGWTMIPPEDRGVAASSPVPTVGTTWVEVPSVAVGGQPTTLSKAIVTLMQDWESWQGTCSELMSVLNSMVNDVPADWPKDAARLAKQLYKLTSVLERLGIRVERGYRGKERVIKLCHRR